MWRRPSASWSKTWKPHRKLLRILSVSSVILKRTAGSKFTDWNSNCLRTSYSPFYITLYSPTKDQQKQKGHMILVPVAQMSKIWLIYKYHLSIDTMWVWSLEWLGNLDCIYVYEYTFTLWILFYIWLNFLSFVHQKGWWDQEPSLTTGRWAESCCPTAEEDQGTSGNYCGPFPS